MIRLSQGTVPFLQIYKWYPFILERKDFIFFGNTGLLFHHLQFPEDSHSSNLLKLKTYLQYVAFIF